MGGGTGKTRLRRRKRQQQSEEEEEEAKEEGGRKQGKNDASQAIHMLQAKHHHGCGTSYCDSDQEAMAAASFG